MREMTGLVMAQKAQTVLLLTEVSLCLKPKFSFKEITPLGAANKSTFGLRFSAAINQYRSTEISGPSAGITG